MFDFYLNDKAVCLACLGQKRLELRPVAFYALIHVTEALAANPAAHFSYDIMAFSPSTILGNVAA